MRYTYKVWVSDGKEHFEYGNEQKKKKDLPFGTSLERCLTGHLHGSYSTAPSFSAPVPSGWCPSPVHGQRVF